jgi:hypothetical protein
MGLSRNPQAIPMSLAGTAIADEKVQQGQERG